MRFYLFYVNIVISNMAIISLFCLPGLEAPTDKRKVEIY